ncbi:FAD/FMN-containing dehydrogenase [Haloactinopolyspora alba]|uniref:FAD/FMN-containing dehydrogenase n=1 Tax=Haloactinopolyspora alba TaxID=648780 RepID=A0A2P8EFF3_9ACTN|nr:FAD-binding oxidoreductase [Haloactinopolyspora alba]PSL08198.1 FAD/FMN-containing dehydrogenase [Haloactinopolyspora alba]
MTTLPTLDTAALTQLRTMFDTRLIAPEDPGYDAARTVFPGDVDHRPSAILRPRDAADVAQALSVVRETGAEVSVRSGGHSLAGHGVSDGGITLDLAEMKDLDIDVDARTAWAGAGLTAGEYTNAVGEHGLATGFGDTGVVGIGGITLGGGVGFLSRRYGLTIDDLLAAEIVTADGSILHVDADNHPDLFWAIRGGGGNFGVVTRFRYRLHEVPTVVGGMMLLPATADVLRGVLAAAAEAPDELSLIINTMLAPPMPFIPADQHGQPVVLLLACYAGPDDDGQRALAPFRAVATPVADMIQSIPYSGMFPPGEGEDFHPTAASRTFYADDIAADTVDTIIDRISSSAGSMRAVQIRPLGGAIDRVANDATAYAHRGRRYMMNITSFYDGADDYAAQEAWVDDLTSALRNGADGAYANFLGHDGTDRVREAYPGGTLDRLAEVKSHYDPTNLFRLNHNIPPAP